MNICYETVYVTIDRSTNSYKITKRIYIGVSYSSSCCEAMSPANIRTDMVWSMILTNNTESRNKKGCEKTTKPETTSLKKKLISLSADEVESEPCTQFL